MEQTLGAEILDRLPPTDTARAGALLAAEIAKSGVKLVVLDDDPTGVQTVHDVSVYTDWSVDSIADGLREREKLFFILTNSRAMTAAETQAVHRQIAANALLASRRTGVPFLLMSRSDSTLRGHYPLETETLREELERGGQAVDGEIMCPFFKEGGRFTIGGVHYVRTGETLVPAARTEFARDRTFGYSRSDLPGYVEEKTGGRYPAEQVTRIGLEQLRGQDYDGIERALMGVRDFGKVCVDAADYCDVTVFAAALYRCMGRGKRFLLRTAAGLVKVMGGVSDIPLLTREDMIGQPTQTGGLVVAGSYTEKTTAQLRALLTLPGVEPIPFRSELVLEGDEALWAEADRCVALEEAAIRAGRTAVCFTSRQPLAAQGDSPEDTLARSVKISRAVQALAGRLQTAPAFIVAKGGITSSDIGTRALGVKKARVLGQIRPGVPVWRTDPGSRFPGVPYVIFPGNVGDEDTLRQAVEILQG